jgi:hypothetical protein
MLGKWRIRRLQVRWHRQGAFADQLRRRHSRDLKQTILCKRERLQRSSKSDYEDKTNACVSRHVECGSWMVPSSDFELAFDIPSSTTLQGYLKVSRRVTCTKYRSKHQTTTGICNEQIPCWGILFSPEDVCFMGSADLRAVSEGSQECRLEYIYVCDVETPSREVT